MRKILRTQRSARALSILLCSMGVVAVCATVWKTWPQTSSSGNVISTYLTLLWTEELTVVPGFGFKLVYLMILGDIMLISGVIVGILSRQSLLIPGETVWFQCPYCKKKWRSIADTGLVHCPHCNQLIHPKMTDKQ
jgi:DNA-directed RNA polymerase subunit RPC12/RpoP